MIRGLPNAGGLAALGLACSAGLGAQTVQPLIAEFGPKARASFEVSNPTLQPVDVVLEPHSFSITPDGVAVYRSLDDGVRLRLSAMSFTLPPRGSRTVFYEVEADRAPAWSTIFASFTGTRREAGVNVRIDLPHTVYLYQKAKLDRSSIVVTRAVHDAATGLIGIEVENVGEGLDRVMRVSAGSGRDRVSVGGFPMPPGHVRRLELPWDGPPPATVAVEFRRFVVEAPLAPRPLDR